MAECSVGAVVVPDITGLVENDSTLRLALSGMLVYKHVSQKIFRLWRHDFKLILHGEHVLESDEQRVDERCQVGPVQIICFDDGDS